MPQHLLESHPSIRMTRHECVAYVSVLVWAAHMTAYAQERPCAERQQNIHLSDSTVYNMNVRVPNNYNVSIYIVLGTDRRFREIWHQIKMFFSVPHVHMLDQTSN